MKKEINHQILTACIFAFIFIFAILIFESCTHEQSSNSNTIDTTVVRVDTVAKDTTR